MYKALKPKDRERAVEMFNIVFLNDEMRNRNPLHVQILDSCIIGNLLNFPKHIFGFPLGSYGTDGNESLSLLLFAYREERKCQNPTIIFVSGDTERGQAMPGTLDMAATYGVPEVA